MTDNYEIIAISEETESARLPLKWLQYLFYVHVAALALSLTALIPSSLAVTPWFSRLMTAGTAVCLYQLQPAGLRYRKAAILTVVALGLQVLSLLMLTSLLLLVGSILTIIAAYQELYAHADVVESLDSRLAGKWRSLFGWQIVIGILSGFSSVAAVVIMVLANTDPNRIIQLVTGAIVLVALIPGILYLVYLRRTIQVFQT